MTVNSADTAREWLRHWGEAAFRLNRAARLAKDMKMVAGLCRPGPTRDDFLAAADALLSAVRRRPLVTDAAP